MAGGEPRRRADAFAAMKRLGAMVVHPPTAHAWGPGIAVQDRDGRTVEVSERAR